MGGKAIVSIDDICKSPQEIQLNKYISLPSSIHGYSLAIEFMRDWILKSFPTDFFKTVHINGKHVLADYKRLNKEIRREIEPPALAIMPTVNTDYNREMVDLIQGGLNIYTRRSNLDKRFFIDKHNNLFISVMFKQIEMPFTFKMRVKTRAQQMDLMEYTRLNCRIGSTQTHFIDIDCHIPNDIIMSLAIDAGFKVKEDTNGQFRVVNTLSFLKYLNANSLLPFLYKLRAINGRQEYFIRVPNCYTHINCSDGITIDDGETIGSTSDNYHVEFNATLHFSVPAIFAYSSSYQHHIANKEIGDITAMYQIISLEPPEVNERGWHKMLETQWIDDSKHIEEIQFSELLEDETLMQVIKFTIDSGVSPSIFLDIKMYNGQKDITGNIDWEKYKMILGSDVREAVSDIAIYADLEYINTTITNLKGMNSNRIDIGDKEVF